MDRIPPAPSGGTAEDDTPSPELLAAVEQASRHLGVGGRAGGRVGGRPGAARPVLRFDAAGTGRRRVWVLGALLALSVAVAALAPLARPREQPAADVEADLRWAVAGVVREVEAHRARTGALPGPEVLEPLLGEHVEYRATGGSYVVSAERDGVRVRFDGTAR
ncbi:MAG: hypothetical protein FIA95_06210 [Gemmatimonadetes bacterium]|nr:hypothetical protein [Gemmatimonadota bacterium]